MNCQTTNCHTTNCQTTALAPAFNGSSIALLGHPNVGKSVIFHHLTGQHVAVSNYPGTTVELARGRVKSLPETMLVDTPGVVTFPPHSEDEQVTARVLLDGSLGGLLQVGDAKNLRRTLLLTVQLAEMGLPMVLALNMMDEAAARGLHIDQAGLEQALGLPVLPTVAVRGQGVDALLPGLQRSGSLELPLAPLQVAYPPAVEEAAAAFSGCLSAAGLEALPISARALALLYLSGDQTSEAWLAARLEPAALAALAALRANASGQSPEPLAAAIQQARLAFVETAVLAALLESGAGPVSRSARISTGLGRLTTHPVWGLFILAGVLYGLFWFVGVFGAGTLVGLLEETLFGQWINPWLTGLVARISPFPLLTDFVVGEYGLWTMGATYAVALIFPIVTTFFLAFGVLEDSGYLPRLAALSNRIFQSIGLNGKAVLPMVLGLGCVTMAALTTRVLETRRERLLVTLLLALAVPCSAQLGVVMGMLAGVSFGAAVIWSGVVLLVMLAVGWLAARLLPGERTSLLVELPPLRLPQFSNVALKTLARLEWYAKEVVPLFLLGAALMFVLDRSGVLQGLMRAGEPLVAGWLGLPPEASAAFLMGFLRRDFGATGLFAMQTQGLLDPRQVVVSMVTITLFVPCIASVMVFAKERGWRTAAGILALVFPLALLVGGLLNHGLLWLGWGGL